MRRAYYNERKLRMRWTNIILSSFFEILKNYDLKKEYKKTDAIGIRNISGSASRIQQNPGSMSYEKLY